MVGINLFSVCVAIPLLVALVTSSFLLFKNLQHIEVLALSTSTSHLPQVMAKQQILLTIESIRRTLTLMYNVQDPQLLNEAGNTAQALVAESTFSALPEIADELGRVRPRVRKLLELKQHLFLLEESFHLGEIDLAAVVGRLGLRMNLEQSLPPHDARSRIQDMLDQGDPNYLKELFSLEPMLTACRQKEGDDAALLEDCQKLRKIVDDLVENQKRLLPMEKELRQLWQTLDAHLQELGDTVSIFEADWIHRGMIYIDEEVKRIKSIFPLLAGGVLIGLLIVTVLVHRLLLWPLSLMSRSLRIIRSGHNITALPQARIRELQDILDVLPDISLYLRELSTRSDRLALERDQYADLSFKDGLTGVLNRRALDASMSRVPSQLPFALLMLDLDYFKAYNDRFGHQAGDTALKTVADVIRRSLLRASDRAYRYGGEEFTVILPDTDGASAMVVAERILHGVSEADLLHPISETGRMTVSIGIACRTRGEDLPVETVLARADQALYQAKNGGRNRIFLYEEKTVPSLSKRVRRTKDASPDETC